MTLTLTHCKYFLRRVLHFQILLILESAGQQLHTLLLKGNTYHA